MLIFFQQGINNDEQIPKASNSGQQQPTAWELWATQTECIW